MSEWKPIETCPLNRRVLMFHPKFGHTQTPRITCERTSSGREHERDGYTHWMEAPDFPADPTP